MFKAVQYFGRFQQFQGGFSSLPAWARLIVFIFALPAIAIAALAIALLGVSILALLLLTLPVYKALSAVSGRRTQSVASTWVDARAETVSEVSTAPTGRRQIEVKIIE